MRESEFKLLLSESAEKYGITLNELHLQKMFAYKQLLMEWNEKMNLTAIEEDREIIYKHFIDSLIVQKHIPAEGIKLIDIGTGAGFPGIPLKIINPSVRITLLDSLAKRLRFLDHIIHELALKEIETIHMRAEEGGRKTDLREQFDVAVARAVAPLAVLLEYCIPYIKTGGTFIAMKGNNANQEIIEAKNAIRQLGVEIEEVSEIEITEIDSKRTILIIKKNRQLSTHFPRKPGIPTKNPI